MRLIDADKLEFNFTSDISGIGRTEKEIKAMEDMAYGFGLLASECVADAPTVDPVKHGHWGKEYYSVRGLRYTIINCSVCGESYDKGFKKCYCPNCGAKMDEVSE